jgi:hypothetical protein
MTWPMADELRVSECDQLIVIDYDLTYDWWVEGIWVWPTVGLFIAGHCKQYYKKWLLTYASM